MKITKRGVALSAMSLMSSAALLMPQESEAVSTSTTLHLTASVTQVVALTLETTENIPTANQNIISQVIDGNTANSWTGTLDFGSVDANGNDSADLTGYFGAVYSYKTSGGPGAHSTANVAPTKKYTLRTDYSGNLHTKTDNGFARSDQSGSTQQTDGAAAGADGLAGGLYVIGADSSDSGLNASEANDGTGGAVRHRIKITAGGRGDLTMGLHSSNAAEPFASPSDSVIPVYVARTSEAAGVSGNTAAEDSGIALVDTDTSSASLPSLGTYNDNTGRIIALGKASHFDVGTWFSRTSSNGTGGTDGKYGHNEWDTLYYGVLIQSAETTGAKSTIVQYTLTV